jgi:hypothetical protein
MNKKVIAVHQPNLMPWLGYFYKWYKADLMVFLDDVIFPRRSLTNRVRIRNQSEKIWVTIPVHQKGLRDQFINKMEIYHEVSWRPSLLGKLRVCYLKSPFFKKYFPELEALIGKEYNLLVDLNVELLKWLAEKLDIQTPWVFSSSIEGVEGKAGDRLVSICLNTEGTDYLSGFGGQNYQEEAAFNAAGINLAVYDFKHPEYSQFQGDFIPGLSAIDLLFNHGPESPGVLRESGSG